MQGECESENSDGDDTQSFALALSTEKGRFFRRTCPSCGRDFKTEVDAADLQWAIAPQMRRIGAEIGVDLAQKRSQASFLYCPYCDHRAETGETMTQATITYLHRFVTREILLPMIHQAFSGIESSSSRQGSFVSVEFRHERAILPPRPIHGPEPPDMRAVEFLCCGKKTKVSHNWIGVSVCTYCGTPVILV